MEDMGAEHVTCTPPAPRKNRKKLFVDVYKRPAHPWNAAIQLT